MQTYVYGHKNAIATIKLSLSWCAYPLYSLTCALTSSHWICSVFLIKIVNYNYKCTFNVFSGSEMLKFLGLRLLVPASDRVPRPLTLHLAVVVTMALTYDEVQVQPYIH